eukprot:998342-Prorocentrum_minimum.AAC.1
MRGTNVQNASYQRCEEGREGVRRGSGGGQEGVRRVSAGDQWGIRRGRGHNEVLGVGSGPPRGHNEVLGLGSRPPRAHGA